MAPGERKLWFHLNNSRYLSSIDRAARFLDLPFDIPNPQNHIKAQEKESTKAAEAVRLAREGLRFRKGE